MTGSAALAEAVSGNNAAFSGERATATFGCLSQTGPGPEKALELLSAE